MDIKTLLVLIAISGALAETKKVRAVEAYAEEDRQGLIVPEYKANLDDIRKAEELLKTLLYDKSVAPDEKTQYLVALGVLGKVAKVFARSCLLMDDVKHYLDMVREFLPEVTVDPLAVEKKLKQYLDDEYKLTLAGRNVIYGLCNENEACDYLIYERAKNEPALQMSLETLLKVGRVSSLYLSQLSLFENAVKNNSVEKMLYTNAPYFIELAKAFSLVLHDIGGKEDQVLC